MLFYRIITDKSSYQYYLERFLLALLRQLAIIFGKFRLDTGFRTIMECEYAKETAIYFGYFVCMGFALGGGFVGY